MRGHGIIASCSIGLAVGSAVGQYDSGGNKERGISFRTLEDPPLHKAGDNGNSVAAEAIMVLSALLEGAVNEKAERR